MDTVVDGGKRHLRGTKKEKCGAYTGRIKLCCQKPRNPEPPKSEQKGITPDRQAAAGPEKALQSG